MFVFALFLHLVSSVLTQVIAERTWAQLSCDLLFNETAAGADVCGPCTDFGLCQSSALSAVGAPRLANADCCWRGNGQCEARSVQQCDNPVAPPTVAPGLVGGPGGPGAKCLLEASVSAVGIGAPGALSSAPNSIRIRANQFVRTTFTQEAGGIVRVPNGMTTAVARTPFDGPSGLYLLEIAMQPEDDGAPRYRFGTSPALNDPQVNWLTDFLVLPSRAEGSGRFCCVRFSWGPFLLQSQDILVVEGETNLSAWARWRSLTAARCHIPAVAPSLPPVARLPPSLVPTAVSGAATAPSVAGAQPTAVSRGAPSGGNLVAPSPAGDSGDLILVLIFAAIVLVVVLLICCLWCCLCAPGGKKHRRSGRGAAPDGGSPLSGSSRSKLDHVGGAGGGAGSRRFGPPGAAAGAGADGASLQHVRRTSRSGSLSRIRPVVGGHIDDGDMLPGDDLGGGDVRRSRRHSRMHYLAGSAVVGGGAGGGGALMLNASQFAANSNSTPTGRGHTRRPQHTVVLGGGSSGSSRRSQRASRTSIVVGTHSGARVYDSVPSLPAPAQPRVQYTLVPMPDKENEGTAHLAPGIGPGPSLINRHYDRVGNIFKPEDGHDSDSEVPEPPSPDKESQDEQHDANIQYEDVTRALAQFKF